MASLGDLVVNLTGNVRPLQKSVATGRATITSFTGSAVSQLAKLGLAFQGLKAVGGLFAKLAGPVQMAADFESMTVRMETMLGSLDLAKSLLADIENFSAATPFQQDELNEAAAQLLAFGFSQDEVMDNLKNLGDIAAGTQKPIGDFVDILGKVRAGGVAAMGDVNRLADRGVPIYKALADTMGVAQSEVRTLVSTGKVGFAEMQAALRSTTAEGGLFAGSMEKQSGTLNGLWSTFKDNVSIVLRFIGNALVTELDFKGLVARSTTFVQTFKTEWLPSVMGVIKAVGETLTGFGILAVQIWNDWLGQTVNDLVFAVQNYDVLWNIAVEQVKLFASNAWERFKTFFVNSGEMFTWFLGNWRDVLKSIGDLIVTAVVNYAKNFSDFFAAIYDFAMGKGFTFEATSLTDGYKSSIKELPKLTKAAVQESTPELERLYGQLGQREAAARQRALAKKVKTDTPKPTSVASQDESGKRTTEQKKTGTVAALEARSSEGLSAVLNMMIRPGENQQKAIVNNTKETAKHAKKTAEQTEAQTILLKSQKRPVYAVGNI